MKLIFRIFSFILIINVAQQNLSAQELPNMIPYKPDSWYNDFIIVSDQPDTSFGTAIYAENTSYIDFACVNRDADIAGEYTISFYIDDQDVININDSDGINENYYKPKRDFEYVFPEEGQYTLKYICDSNNQVQESNENDNVYEQSIYVFSKTPPTNDNFFQAIEIKGNNGSLKATNASATKETGEPKFANRKGVHSVWWKWTPSDDGEYIFDTYGSTFNTVLAICQGSDAANLTQCEENDDDQSPNNSTFSSKIVLRAKKFRQYYIAVDGWAKDDFGVIHLNWSSTVMVLYEDFEGDTSSTWSSNASYSAVNLWTIGGSATSKEGSRSAYISNTDGVTDDYNVSIPAKSVLISKEIDLSFVSHPVLTFFWKCMGEKPDYFDPGDNGELYIDDGTAEYRMSFYFEYRNNNDWKEESIILDQFEGKKISLKFVWFNGFEYGQSPGLCIDNVKIVGVSTPTPNIKCSDMIFDTEDAYTGVVLATDFYNEPISITSANLPTWIHPISSNGELKLIGRPDQTNTGIYDILLSISTPSQSFQQHINIYVPETHHVETLQSYGDNSLPVLISKANPFDYIVFDVEGTVYLDEYSAINLTRPIHIIGPTSSQLSLTFADYYNTIFYINDCDMASISHVVIEKIEGIYSNKSKLILSNVIIQGNSAEKGGGISLNKGELHLSNSIIKNNHAETEGGAIHNNFGTISISNCSIENNSAKNFAAIFNSYGTIDIVNSSITNNIAESEVGAIYNENGTISIVNTTIGDNSAMFLGGIYNKGGMIYISHSTIANNNSQQSYVKNGFSGIYNTRSGIVYLTNSILSNNKDNGILSNANLDYMMVLPNNYIGDLPSQLSPLMSSKDHITKYYLLKNSSQLIDAGSCETIEGSIVSVDQRGIIRPTNEKKCDIGAIEITMNDCEQFNILSKPPPIDYLTIGESYAYTLIFFNPVSQLYPPKLLPDNAWLHIDDRLLSEGKLVLEGKPDITSVGVLNVVVELSNEIKSVSQSFQLTVVSFEETFETDVSQWIMSNNRWKISKNEAFSGEQAAYIAASEMDYSQSILKRMIDLTDIDTPKLSFYWKCKSFSLDNETNIVDFFGKFYVKDRTGMMILSQQLYPDSDWKQERINLSSFSGKEIELGFIWYNEKRLPLSTTGLAIDNILITGHYTSRPIFIHCPETNIMKGETYKYPVDFNHDENTTISSLSIPYFLELKEISSGNIEITGTPEAIDIGSYPIIIEASNLAGSTILSYTLDVLWFYETFETNSSQWQIYEKYSGNQWVISTSDPNDINTYAYVSYNNRSPFVNLLEPTVAYLKHFIDLTHIDHPVLQFEWFSPTNDGYGEVFIRDMDGSLKRVSDLEELQENASWKNKRIDLEKFKGKEITLIFQWVNQRVTKYFQTGCCIDNIEIIGNYTESPVKDAPIFISHPDHVNTVIGINESFSYTISTIDMNNDPVQVTCLGCPDWLTLISYDSYDLLTGIPTNKYMENYNFSLIASDGLNETEQAVNIYVKTETDFKYFKMYPTPKNLWYFNTIKDIALDSKDNVYVLDKTNHRVIKYSPKGQLLSVWGKKGAETGEFKEPEEIDIDINDNIYVCDSGNNRIQKFNPDNEFMQLWEGELLTDWLSESASFQKARMISLDTKGNIYISNGHEIKKFNPILNILEEKFVPEIESYILYINDMDVDILGNIYVVNYGGYIYKYNNKGNKLLVFDRAREFNHENIAIDKAGYIYADDSKNNGVVQFNDRGEFITNWSLADNLKNTLEITSIDIDLYGNIYTAFFGELNFDIHERSYKIETQRGAIKKHSSTGKPILSWQSFGSGSGQFFHPNGMITDHDDHLYVCDQHNQRIQKLIDDNKWVNWTTEEIDMIPYDIALYDRPKNDLFYVTDIKNNRILRFNENGFIDEIFGDLLLRSPRGIDIDQHNFIYVADSDNYRIIKLDLACNIIEENWQTFKETSTPNDIAIDRNNNWIFVSDSLSNCIFKFDYQGNELCRWGNDEINVGKLNSPYGIALNNDNIFVANQKNNNILVYSSSGKLLDEFGQPGLSPGSLFHPTGITFGKNNVLFISDASLNRVQFFKQIKQTGITKAIIVAGQKSEKDDVWDAIKANANFANYVLNCKGINKDLIYYLNPEDFDLDLNGINDDIDGLPTKEQVKKAIEQWVFEEPIPETLIVYLVDHGINDNDVGIFVGANNLSNQELKLYLNDLTQQLELKNIEMQIFVLNDSCYSGSFLELDTSEKRVVFTSTDHQSNAKMLLNGNISFSMYFWTQILQDQSIGDAFNTSYNAMNSFQTPMKSPYDIDLSDIYVGLNNTISAGSPIINNVEVMRINNGNTSDLFISAEVKDDGLIKKVSVYINPQNDFQQTQIARTVYDIEPDLELTEIESGYYEGLYTQTYYDGSYNCLIIAEDTDENVSSPVAKPIDIQSSLRRKAVLIASNTNDKEMQSAISTVIHHAYNALRLQEYHDEDIYILANNIEGIDNENIRQPSLDNFENDLLNQNDNVKEFVIFMVGQGWHEAFVIDSEHHLSADQLRVWLDVIQPAENNDSTEDSSYPLNLIVVYDACMSETFIPVLSNENIPKNRILISSSFANAYFAKQGVISFSYYFWDRISSGAKLYNAFIDTLSYIENAFYQKPCLNSNGDALCDSYEDAIITHYYRIGAGIGSAFEKPVISDYSMTIEQDQFGSHINILGEITNAAEDTKLLAVIVDDPQHADLSDPVQACEYHLTMTEMTKISMDENRYLLEDFKSSSPGLCQVVLFAIGHNGTVSEPKTIQIFSPDMYENDDTMEDANIIWFEKEQYHNLYQENDVDWFKFFALKDQTYEILVYNVDINTDVVIELYTNPVIHRNNLGKGMNESIVKTFNRNDIYHLKISNNINQYGDNTSYMIKISQQDLSPNEIFINGKVFDRSNDEPIKDVILQTDRNTSSLTDKNGRYSLLGYIGKPVTISAEKSQYRTNKVTIDHIDKHIENFYIGLIPYDLDELFLTFSNDCLFQGETIEGTVTLKNGWDGEKNLLVGIGADNNYIFFDESLTIYKGQKEVRFNVIGNSDMILNRICTHLTIEAWSNYHVSDYSQICLKSKCFDIDPNEKIDLNDAILAMQIIHTGQCNLQHVITILKSLGKQ